MGSGRGVALRLCALVLTVLALGAQSSSAQESARLLPRFRVLLSTGERIEGLNGSLTTIGLQGSHLDGRAIALRRSDVRSLDAVVGSLALRGAGFGAGVGGGVSVLALLQGSSDPATRLDGTAAATAFGATVLLGAAIGAVVGARHDRWEHVTLAPSAANARHPNPGISIGYTMLSSRASRP